MVQASSLAQYLIVALAAWLVRQQEGFIEYLKAENRMLKARLGRRPIVFTDAERRRLARHAKTLSPEARYLRFMGTVRELTPAMLARLTQIDYDREMALIAVVEEATGEREIGVCRYAIKPDGESCEFAIAIADDLRRRGLGRRLMVQLVDVARGRGLKTMIGHVLATNQPMLAFAQALGFEIADSRGDATVKRATLVLNE